MVERNDDEVLTSPEQGVHPPRPLDLELWNNWSTTSQTMAARDTANNYIPRITVDGLSGKEDFSTAAKAGPPSESTLRSDAIRAMFGGQCLRFDANSKPIGLTDNFTNAMTRYFSRGVDYLIPNPFRDDQRPSVAELETRARELLTEFGRTTLGNTRFRVATDGNGIIQLQHQGLGPGRWVTEDIGFRVLQNHRIEVVNPRTQQVYGTIAGR